MPPKKSKSKGQDQSAVNRTTFRAEWIRWGFWSLCICLLAAMVFTGMPGAIIPALGTGLAFALTRSGVTERLRPYHPAYCVGTAMIIWLLWTVMASGNRDLLIDLGLLLLGLGFVSLLPGIISASLLSLILVSYAGVVWSQRGEATPEERSVITVEVTLLLLTVAATWAGFMESQLQQARPLRRKKKATSRASGQGIADDEIQDE